MKFLSNVIKKITIVLSLIAMVSVSLFSNVAFGADLYYRIMNGDSQQSALLLAELGEVDVSMEASSNIKILRCVNGTVDTFSTKLNKIDNSNDEYSAGDKVLVSVSKRFFGGYDVCYFMEKVSVLDNGLVKFEEEYYPDLFALEWYVNTGDREFAFRGFSGKKGTAVYLGDKVIYREMEDGKKEYTEITEPRLNHKNNVLVIEAFYNKHKTLLIVICCVFLVALIGFRIWFGIYWKNKKNPPNSITEQ